MSKILLGYVRGPQGDVGPEGDLVTAEGTVSASNTYKIIEADDVDEASLTVHNEAEDNRAYIQGVKTPDYMYTLIGTKFDNGDGWQLRIQITNEISDIPPEFVWRYLTTGSPSKWFDFNGQSVLSIDTTAVASDVRVGKTYLGSDTNNVVGTGSLNESAGGDYRASESEKRKILNKNTILNGDVYVSQILQSNIAPSNIKNGTLVRVYSDISNNAYDYVRVTGTLGADKTATAGDVRTGKTFIGADGAELTGTLKEAEGTTIRAINSQITAIAANTIAKGDIKVGALGHNNFSAANIKNGVNIKFLSNGTPIYEYTGTYGSDATAAAANIYTGKTAYGPSGKITGTMTVNSLTSFSVAAVAGTKNVTLSWGVPAAATGKPYSGVLVRYKTGSAPTSTSDGTQIYSGVGSSSKASTTSTATVTMPANSTTYYFTIWPYATINNSSVYGTTRTASTTTATGEQYTAYTTSGSFSPASGFTKMDIFLVGGGASGLGKATTSNDDSNYTTYGCRGGFGGYSGYVTLQKDVAITSGSMAITIGAGGAYSGGASSNTAGGATSVVYNGNTYTANGGKSMNYYSSMPSSAYGNAGPGGVASVAWYSYNYSGNNNRGGGHQGNGGTNGGDGTQAMRYRDPLSNPNTPEYYNGGKGSGVSSSFHNVSYAGAGAGGYCGIYKNAASYAFEIEQTEGAGGAGGGANGASYSAAAPAATANTGGGGGGLAYSWDHSASSYKRGNISRNGSAGASGIVVIRYHA